MKKYLLICSLIPGALLPAGAVSISTYSYSGPAYTIADGNPIGVSSGILVSGAESSLLNLRVTLNLAGGYNGDLFGYLSYSGEMVPLLNRIGVSSVNPFGSDGAGMSVTFTDLAAGNIHAAGNGLLSGMYRPDGQDLSPLSPPGSFSPNGGAITLNGTFASVNPNGAWTLYLVDVVSGGGATTVTGWSLQATSVPEPDPMLLGALSLAAGLVFRQRPEIKVRPP